MAFITPLHRPHTAFAKMLGGYGEEVREAKDIQPALCRARESGSPGTMHQTMYK
jgi:hypothetical protein